MEQMQGSSPGRHRFLVLVLASQIVLANVDEGAAQNDLVAHYLIISDSQLLSREQRTDLIDFMTDYLEQETTHFKGRIVRGWLTNRPDSAASLLAHHNPELIFTPIDFYLQHFLNNGQFARPILELPKSGAEFNRYYLVANRDGPELGQLNGDLVRGQWEFDPHFLQSVVFPSECQPGISFTYEASENMIDEIFRMNENTGGGFNIGEMGTAAAILLNSQLKNIIAQDELMWSDLKVVWRSEILPNDLIVIAGDSWRSEEERRLTYELARIAKSPKASKILELLRCTGFEPANEGLLQSVTSKYLLAYKPN